MGKDRLIWRPNSVSPEDWDALSRDEQVKWWRDREPPNDPSPHPLRAVELYCQGVITPVGFPSYVFSWLTETNVGEFLVGCPKDLLFVLRDDAAKYPKDDDDLGWDRLITIMGGTYAPWVTPEEIERSEQEQRRQLREGIRLFRRTTSGTH